MARADSVPISCIPYVGSLVTVRALEAIEANIRSYRSFASDLQFGSKMARSDLSRPEVRMSDPMQTFGP